MTSSLCFAADVTLGKLGRHLRSAGFEFQQKDEKNDEC